MIMKIKFEKKVELTQEQLLELATILTEPDITWQGELDQMKQAQYKRYDVESNGEHGTYNYRVNLSHQIITIKSVE